MSRARSHVGPLDGARRPRTLPLVLALTVGAAAGVGCGDRQEAAPAPRPTAPAPVTPALRLHVDGAAGPVIPASAVQAWPRLDTLLPEDARRLGRWARVTAEGARPWALERPFEVHRDAVPALFPGPGGAIAFGIFDPVELGRRGTPRVRVDGVTALRIELDASGARGGNDHGDQPITDPAALALVITHPGGEARLDGPTLLALPREPQPGGDEPAGWRLQALLAKAGVTTYEKLVLHDAGGTTLPLAAAELGADAIAFVKLNRQGALRFRLYRRQGDGWQQGGDLRALARIQIVK